MKLSIIDLSKNLVNLGNSNSKLLESQLKIILDSEQLTDLMKDAGNADYTVEPNKLWYVDINGIKELT